MRGMDVKRGIAATMERVVAAAGSRFASLDVVWYGTTAGINFKHTLDGIKAKVIFPAIDEVAEIDRATFNNLIGFALHEGLGHACFTQNKPWDEARHKYGEYVSNLINGLEDPRIEQKAIDSGYAPNSKPLFENLLNAVLDRDGYVDANDIKNIPFLLAVEGRRLNGYNVNVPSITDQSAIAKHLHAALDEARRSPDTQGVVDAAVKLFKAIQSHEKKQGNTNTSPSEEKRLQDDPSGSEQGSEQGEQQGSEPDDKQDKKQSKRSDKGGGRSVEPSSFISDSLSDKVPQMDKAPVTRRPIAGKPEPVKFIWC